MRRHNKDVQKVDVQVTATPAPEGAMAAVLAAVAKPIPPVTVEKIVPGEVESLAIVATIAAAEPVKVRKFRVMRERSYVDGGMKCILREGAIVDNSSRDIDAIRRQGVPLEELKE